MLSKAVRTDNESTASCSRPGTLCGHRRAVVAHTRARGRRGAGGGAARRRRQGRGRRAARTCCWPPASASALSALLGYLASYFIARRLKRIERSAETSPAATSTPPCEVTVEDEIGQLAATFNIMAVRLREAFAAVEYERDRIEVLLTDLSEGVVGVAVGRGAHHRQPGGRRRCWAGRCPWARRWTRPSPATSRSCGARRARTATGQDIVFVHGDRTLEATTYPVGGEADFTSIVVLRDVTAQAKLERARRDLIANASHEFKTPLFSLAGFLELIDEGDLSPEEQQEFLQLMRAAGGPAAQPGGQHARPVARRGGLGGVAARSTWSCTASPRPCWTSSRRRPRPKTSRSTPTATRASRPGATSSAWRRCCARLWTTP